jgi:methyl-accepting chemotaxis protein
MDGVQMTSDGTEYEEGERTTHQFTLQVLLDTLDLPAFALNVDSEVVAWDEQIADLLGTPRDQVLGSDSLGADLYGEDQRDLTLAEKVVRSPERAHQEYSGVSRAEGEYALLDGEFVYEDTSTINGAEIWFIATPVYHRDEFVGVLEIVQDITSSARYQQELEGLFAALTETISAYERGQYGERVEFETDDSLLEDEFLHVVDAVDEMGAATESLVKEVREDTQQLQQSADDIAERSQEINAVSSEQAESMTTISSEVSNMSATIEEIASTAETVATTSDEAEELAEAGNERATEATSVLEDVSTSAESVVDDVAALQGRIEDIDEIITVINDIADQTNLLALNASIEAARAGEAGEGFAVVADEVKSLAEESQENAAEIEEMVTEIQSETEDTVENLATTTQQIEESIEQVEDAMDRFGEIVDAVEEVANGIQQVSNATDDQAASAEEIASMVDEAVDQAQVVSESVDDIVANTEEQAAMVGELSESVDRLAGEQ